MALEKDAFFTKIAQYFNDIGEVKSLAVYLGYSKNCINRVNTEKYPELVEMSKTFMEGYVANYGIKSFIGKLEDVEKKMKKKFMLPSYDDYKNFTVAESDFEKREIVNTFPSYELIIEMAFELIEKSSQITYFITMLHCRYFTEWNPRFFLVPTDVADIRRRLEFLPESVDHIFLAKCRGLDVCGTAEECKVDIFERVFELLCYWKEYSYVDNMNYEVICVAFNEIGSTRYAKKIHDKYFNWKNSEIKTKEVLVEKAIGQQSGRVAN
ncbi:Hypothetical predicted protein [Octopus vulgaris]|uniref:Uncharacterized protein n=1 Tax=Octopus vulgaris TaxID=6645 RepID=A0AA36B008_OCTVU|nr:Hypothetical predicted protein [Octopus vulgaris]